MLNRIALFVLIRRLLGGEAARSEVITSGAEIGAYTVAAGDRLRGLDRDHACAGSTLYAACMQRPCRPDLGRGT